MTILLLGAGGQLGRQLEQRLCALGEVVALTRASSDWCGDLADAAGIARTVRGIAPGIIVNAAAYTQVDQAEAEVDTAFAINARACETIACEAARLDAWLMHYSTEYVFDGSGERPWRESDTPAPLNAYGRSKLAGEQAIAAHCPKHLILRTSWLFDAWGDNFLTWLLDAAARRPSLDIVSDQWGAPTSAALLAQVSVQMLRSVTAPQAGIYHVAASGVTSRHGMATYALQCAREHGLPLQAGPDDLRAVGTEAFPRPAKRPANSRLDTHRVREAFGVVLPSWESGVRAAVAERAAAGRPSGGS